YSAFEKTLLTLQQRLANSTDPKDRVRAAQLKSVLDLSGIRDVSKKFALLVKYLNEQEFKNTEEIRVLVNQSNALAKDLKELLDLLKNDNGAGGKKEERLALEKFVKELEKVIRDQKLVRSQIGTNPDKDAVKGSQEEVTQKTADLKDKLGKDGKGGEGG